MTVQTTESQISYNGNDVATNFSITFPFFQKSDIVVTLYDSSGVGVIQVLDSDYTIPGVSWASGGSVVMVVPPSTGETIIISRMLDLIQTAGFRNLGQFRAEVHEDTFDKIIMMLQQISYGSNGLNRAIKIPNNEDVEELKVKLPNDRANSFLGFDSNKNLKSFPLSGSESITDPSLIGNYATYSFDRISDIDGNTYLSVGDLISVDNYSSSCLSGRLFFKIVSSGTGIDDGYKYIDLPILGFQLQQNLSIPYNVKAGGATGDGSTDDIDSIDAVTDYVSSIGGGKIFFPAGTYIISAEYKIPSYCEVFGEGIISSIKLEDGTDTSNHVITNASNNRLSRTTYDENIYIHDIAIDGNKDNLTGSVIDDGSGSDGLALSTVRNVVVERVYATNCALHCFDVLASTYWNDGDIESDPDGSSYHIAFTDCIADHNGYDDGFTTHNSGDIEFTRCIANWTGGSSPNTWSCAFEFDEGTYNTSAVDCKALGGWPRGYASKGHPTTRGSLYTNYTRCRSDGSAQGWYIYHSNSTGDSNNRAVTLTDCEISNVDVTVPTEVTEEEHLIDIVQTKSVMIKGLRLRNIDVGNIRVTGAEIVNVQISDVQIEGTILDGAITDTSIFMVRGSIPSTNIVIENVFSHLASPRPAVFIEDTSGNITVQNIGINGSDSAHGIVKVTSMSDNLTINRLSGSGWGGSVYDKAYSQLYDNYLTCSLGNFKTMSIASGSPEGVVYAPAGTILSSRSSGNLFKKNSAGNLNTGWVQFATV